MKTRSNANSTGNTNGASNIFKKHLQEIENKGYTIIKKCIAKKDCKRLIYQTLLPIINKKGIYLNNKKSFEKYMDGVMLWGDNYGHIIPRSSKHFRFKALFDSEYLNTLINLYHNRNYSKNHNCNNNQSSKWEYNYLAKEGLGWIHLRFPYFDYNNYRPYIQESIPNCFHLDNLILPSNINYELEPNYSDNNNNNDNGNNDYNNYYNNYIINEKQSLIIIPYITTVKDKGGGTVVIEESHKKVQEHLITKGNNNIEKLIEDISDNLSHKLNIKEITAEQGDILIMHPHLIHSSSYVDINSKTRILFNLSVQTK
jgi:hypothetical protein